ncbi:hypothetical protein ACWCOW_27255 [Streptomyces sp. NPDC001939]
MTTTATTWEVIEQAETPKVPGAGEDRLVLIDDTASALELAAVIDGATDKSGRDYDGMNGGALAASTVAEVLAGLDPATEPVQAVGALSTALAALRASAGIAPNDPVGPSAVAAVFVPARGEIWRVGDVHIALGSASGWREHPADKRIDRVLAGARAAYLHCLMAEGMTANELAQTDPGREVILPVLRRQGRLANRLGPFGYGVLDGTPVPADFIEVIPVDASATNIVLASDGYLTPARTLAAAEADLADSLRQDPLRIGQQPATKGIKPGSRSFDDRTYVRLALH